MHRLVSLLLRLGLMATGFASVSVVYSADDLVLSRYAVSADGIVVRDTLTGLEWQRCSVGQRWRADNNRCEGRADAFIWQDARSIQHKAEDGAPDWRTPTVGELRSLVYCSSHDPVVIGMDRDWYHCLGNYKKPTIVGEVFPNTPIWYFWSSSPLAGDEEHAWAVYFGEGLVNFISRTSLRPVRLVRNSAQ